MFSLSHALGWVLGKREGSGVDPAPQGLTDRGALSLFHEKELPGGVWSEPQEEGRPKNAFPQLQLAFLTHISPTSPPGLSRQQVFGD